MLLAGAIGARRPGFDATAMQGSLMHRVNTILARKGNEVLTVAGGELVFEAIRQMAEAGVGSILVVDAGALRGIFTERDYLRRIALQGRHSQDTRVEEVMTAELICVGPDESVEQCMAIMTERHIRHLPVMRGDQLLGVVSIGDLVRQVTRQLAEEIKYLTDYVSGAYPG